MFSLGEEVLLPRSGGSVLWVFSSPIKDTMWCSLGPLTLAVIVLGAGGVRQQLSGCFTGDSPEDVQRLLREPAHEDSYHHVLCGSLFAIKLLYNKNPN